MVTMLAERLVEFVVECETRRGTECAVVLVYFPKKGGVNTMCSPGQGFHLTKKKGPANWATWDFRNYLREVWCPDDPIPTYLEIALWADQFRQEHGHPGLAKVIIKPGLPVESCHQRSEPPRALPRARVTDL